MASGVLAALAADYTGPKPPKADMLYLVHADNLIPTEAGQAEETKNANTYTIPGASSSVRTPLAEPIFLLQSDRVTPDSLELYKLDVKGGHRRDHHGWRKAERQGSALGRDAPGARPLPYRSRRGAGQRGVRHLADGLQSRILLPDLLERGNC